MVKDKDTVWVGLEYFCTEGDDLWNSTDEAMANLAIEELSKVGIIDKKDVLDRTVIRMQKTYPAYFGTYEKFNVVRDYLDRFENLFLIGRNGMHRYNNQDHSMLTGMLAARNVRGEHHDLWEVNTERSYYEEFIVDEGAM